jgi:hypothetical protein
MALPTLTKTYQFDINNTVPAAGGTSFGTDANTDRKQLLYEIVDSLTNGTASTFTVPFTVVASSNSVTAGAPGPGWSSGSDCVWADRLSSNARSWIVLDNTGLGVEILITCETVVNTEGGGIGIFVSAAGFDVSSPVTTAAPTATDQAEIRNKFNNRDGCWSGLSDGTPRQFVWSIVASNDGEVWNTCIFHNSVIVGYWRWEKPANPPTGWTQPFVGGCLGESSDTVDADSYQNTGLSGTADSYFCCIDGTRRGDNQGQNNAGTLNTSQRTVVRPYSWSFGSGTNRMCNTQLTTAHPLTGNPLLWPIWWVTPAAGVGPGRVGRATDLWLKQQTVGGAIGDTYPSNPSTPQFLVIGDSFIIPWDGSTAPIIS